MTDGILITSERAPLAETFQRARSFIAWCRESTPPPTMDEIRSIYRMARYGTIVYRLKIT